MLMWDLPFFTLLLSCPDEATSKTLPGHPTPGENHTSSVARQQSSSSKTPSAVPREASTKTSSAKAGQNRAGKDCCSRKACWKHKAGGEH